MAYGLDDYHHAQYYCDYLPDVHLSQHIMRL
jgi:hypothetical protein